MPQTAYGCRLLANLHLPMSSLWSHATRDQILLRFFSPLIYYILTTASPPSSPLLSVHPPNLPCPPTPPQFPLRKGQASQGYQPNKAYQGVIRLGTCPGIKAEQADRSETVPASTVRGSTRRPYCTTRTYMQRA